MPVVVVPAATLVPQRPEPPPVMVGPPAPAATVFAAPVASWRQEPSPVLAGPPAPETAAREEPFAPEWWADEAMVGLAPTPELPQQAWPTPDDAPVGQTTVALPSTDGFPPLPQAWVEQRLAEDVHEVQSGPEGWVLNGSIGYLGSDSFTPSGQPCMPSWANAERFEHFDTNGAEELCANAGTELLVQPIPKPWAAPTNGFPKAAPPHTWGLPLPSVLSCYSYAGGWGRKTTAERRSLVAGAMERGRAQSQRQRLVAKAAASAVDTLRRGEAKAMGAGRGEPIAAEVVDLTQDDDGGEHSVKRGWGTMLRKKRRAVVSSIMAAKPAKLYRARLQGSGPT